MKRQRTRILSMILALALLAGMLPAEVLAAPEGERPDYSVTPDYAARYSHGVLEFSAETLSLEENGPGGELRLIRKGGLEGEVSVRIKVIDVNAHFGEDYIVKVGDESFDPDPDCTGSLMETYIEETDIITSDEEDPEYLELIGYTEPEPLSEEELEIQRDQAIDTVADMLNVTEDQAAAMLAAEPKSVQPEEETEPTPWEGDPDPNAGYASELHALHDAVLGERTPANHSEVRDITDPATLLGDTDRNLAATAVNGEAAGPSVLVTFEEGENEKFIRVEPLDDDRYGAQKVFVLGLYDAQGGAELGEVFDASVVINEDEAPELSYIGFSKTKLTVEHDALYAELEITRSGCIDDYAAITVYTASGTAREGTDYLRVDGGSTFLPGETEKIVIVPLKAGLWDDDASRTFTVRLEAGSDNVELRKSKATVTILAGKGAAGSAEEAELMAGGQTPIVIWGDDLAQEAAAENMRLRSLYKKYPEYKKVYYGDSVTVGGDRYVSYPAGGEINFTGIARVEVDLEKDDAEGYVLRMTAPEKYDAFTGDHESGAEYVGEIVKSSDKTITLSFDFGYGSDGEYAKRWETANTYGIGIYRVQKSSSYSYSYSYFNNNSNTTTYSNPWSASYYTGWIPAGPKISEIRLYPIQIRLGVYDMPSDVMNYNAYRGFESANNNGNKHPVSMAVQSSYRIYTGLTGVQETRTYAAGIVSVPETIYVGEPVNYTLTPSEEGRRHYVRPDGFYRYAPRKTNLYGSEYRNNKGNKRPMGYVLWNSEDIPRTGFVSTFTSSGNYTTIYDFTLVPAKNMTDPMAYTLSPVLANRDVDRVSIAWYDADMGLLRIDGTVFNDATLTRSEDGFTWKEGDELIIAAEPKEGYYFDGFSITRSNGSVETVAAGEPVILSNGMTIAPIFAQYDITLELYWAELGMDIPEDMDFNLEGYQIGYMYSGANEITFTDNGDGSYTFGNLVPGKVLTLWTGPEEGWEKDRTGLWLLDSGDDRVRYDDGAYYLHVGDARAVTIENKDMRMAYYLNPADNMGGTVVTGQVCTKGQDIKHSTSTRITANNAEQTASFLSGVTVSAVCLDPSATRTVRGKTYYTTAETDENGKFSIYVPSGAYGCGITLSLLRDDVYQVVSAPLLLGNGKLLIEMPAQNEHYQFDAVTLGQDTATDEIYLSDTPVNLGLHLVVDEGYTVQNVKLTSYDENNAVLAEWFAEPVDVGPWNYSSIFTPSERLVPGGKLMVEVIDKNGRSMGRVDTGYWIKPELKYNSFVLPQFDPHKSVTLPVFGDVSVSTDFGSTNAKPTEPQADLSNLSPEKATKSPVEIKFGYGSKIKAALRELKLIDADSFVSMNSMEKAAVIEAKLVELYGAGTGGDSSEGEMENKPWFGQGGGKSAYRVNYNIGLYMSMYMNGKAFEFESLTLFANVTVAGSTTQQFSIAGIPLYLTLKGDTTVEGLVTLFPFSGTDTVQLVDPDTSGWINDMLMEQTELGGFFLFTVGISIEAGVGHPSIVAGGVRGKMKYRMGYEPWSEAAAIVDLELSAVFHLGPMELPFKITSASYGIFKTSEYMDTSFLDFSKVKNKDKFGYSTLMSYDDGETLTTVSAGYRQMARAEDVDYGPLTLTVPERSVMLLGDESQTTDGMAALMGDDMPDARVKGLNTCTPVSLPLGEGKGWLLLAFYDVYDRDVNDCSGLVWRTLTPDGNGAYQSGDAAILDDDGTFDSNLTAVRLEDGRVVVVWSNAKHSWGEDPDADLGEMLNDYELRYCIFDENGVPGEVKTLSDLPGCEEVSRIACDPETGKIMIVYSVTDYQTEGIALDESNLENAGNFLYNSYSTVCFKLLDEDGKVITAYEPETESSYIDYESTHGEGSLEGLRYLDVQLSNAQSQAKLDQFTAGAIDGTAYVVYALDTDQDTATDGDRELFAVSYDLSTMESSGPIPLTNNLEADVNPQLLNYNDRLMLFWDHAGTLSCVDVAEASWGMDIAEVAEVLLCDEVGAANYQVEVDPGSGMLWLCWCGSYTVQTDGEQLERSAVFMRVYDKNYAFTDKDGQPLLDEEGNPVSGAWGSTAPVWIARQDNVQFSELNVALLGDVPMLSFKETTLDESGEPEQYLLDYVAVNFPVTYTVEASMSPAWPMAGEQVAASVTAKNESPVPEDVLMLKAELVSDLGEILDLGTVERNGHISSDIAVTETFRFYMPEDPENWVLKLTAYEDDIAEGVTKEVSLPCGADLELQGIATETLAETQHAVSFDVSNIGNQALAGAKIVLEKEPKDLLDANGTGTFETLASVSLDALDAKDVRHVYIPFDLPWDIADSDENNVVWITVEGSDGSVLAKEEILVCQSASGGSAAEQLLIDGSADPGRISLKPGQTKALQASLLPANASENYVITYRAEDPDVVTVDENGRLTAKSPGTTTVYADAAFRDDTVLIGADNAVSSRNGTITMDEYGMLQYTAAEGETLRASVRVTVSEAEEDEPDKEETTITVSPKPANAFVDVPEDAWYAKAVAWAVDRGITAGTSATTFSPDVPCTRAQMVSFLWHVAGKPEPKRTDMPFVDVPAGSYYEKAVLWAVENDITSGMGDTSHFAPDRAVTRAQAVTFLYCYDKAETTAAALFDDVALDAWYAKPVTWAAQKGITVGVGNGKFAPDADCVRAHIVCFLYGYLNQ